MTRTLLYVANARLPSRKAHTYQIVQMCDAFEAHEFEVELLVPDRTQPEDAPNEPVSDYYDTPATFTITRVPCVDFLRFLPRLPDGLARPINYLQAITFTLSALLYTFKSDQEFIYSRAGLYTVVGAFLFGQTMVFETHRGPPRPPFATLVGWSFDRLRGIVAITEGLQTDWQQYTDAKILVEPDGVRLARVNTTKSKAELRQNLDIPADKTVVTYAGSIQPWKGVQILIRASQRLSDEYHVVVVGGTDDQRSWLREEVGDIPESVSLIGHVPSANVPEYLIASDILVVPNTANRRISTRYTSPLKVFEYMAAERPIVVSDLPSLREVLDEETAYFFESNNPESLIDAIHRVTEHPSEAASRAATARERVEQYTWQSRAQRLIDEYLPKQSKV